MKDEHKDKNSAESDSIESLVKLAGPREALPEDVKSRLEAHFRAQLQEVRRGRLFRRASYFAAMAALLVLGIMLSLPETEFSELGSVLRIAGRVELIREDDRYPLSEGSVIPIGARLVSDGGGRALIGLDGSTTLRIDMNSVVDMESARQLRLSVGSVYIDTGEQAGAKSGVTVVTEFTRIVDTGTQYLVTADELKTVVSVREGSVTIITDVTSVESKPLSDMAQQLVFSGAYQLSAEQIDKHGGVWSWVQKVSPRFDTKDRPWYELLHWVSRETGRGLSFDSPEIETVARDEKIIGSFVLRAPERALADLLEASKSLVQLPSEPNVILIGQRKD